MHICSVYVYMFEGVYVCLYVCMHAYACVIAHIDIKHTRYTEPYRTLPAVPSVNLPALYSRQPGRAPQPVRQ